MSPAASDGVAEVVAAAFGGSELTAEARLALPSGPLVFRDPAMLAIKGVVERLAPAPVNVLILGETGVGKDVVASLLHLLSPRTARPLVAINCAGLPEQLLESELFGHERGAFTGAVGAKPGLLETAAGGTAFLDEIGDLPLPLQAKLLRILETRELTRVGATRARRIDVRFIAATNQDLGAGVEAGRFRRDLYYRLATVTVTVPALRDRPADVAPLARAFLESACARFHMPPRELSRPAEAALEEHRWPGNVRELRSAIERAVLFAPGPVIEPAHLALQPGPRPDASGAAPALRPDAAAVPERTRIERALAETGGNQTRAAWLLGMPRRTLVRRIGRLGLRRPRSGLHGAA